MSFPDRPTPRYLPSVQSRAALRRAAAKQATRAALIAAARECFAEDGLDKPSLDVICGRAGYTRGALYIHFRDREALVEAVIEDQLTRLLESLVAQGDSEQVVERLTHALAAEGFPALQLMNATTRSKGLREQLIETLREIARQLEARDSVSPSTAGHALLSRALGAALLQGLGIKS